MITRDADENATGPSADRQELVGGNPKVWAETLQGKGPFSRSSKLFRCFNGSESARPASVSELSAVGVNNVREDKLPCASVWRDILAVAVSSAQRLGRRERGQLETK